MESTESSHIQNATNVVDTNVNCENATLPPGLRFTDQSLTVVIVYCLCFLVAAVGNLTVFLTLSRGRYRKSRISLMICHLAAADLLVTFFMILHEVGWRLTVQWLAGNMACKIFQFLKAFGLYLSSNILVCVSLDRYFAVLHPLRVNDARRRGKWMLAMAWIFSVIYAAPQSFIFHVSRHPDYPDFKQCVTFGFFVSQVDETAYNLFCILAMYFVPLVVICWVYSRILCEISSKSRGTITRSSSNGICSNVVSNNGGRLRLRRSDMSSIERARSRTLRMTITIVAVFILCWTPYVAMTLWYIVDKDSAVLVDARLQDALFIMAVGNSCANPLVYGSYSVDFRKECCWCFFPYGGSTKSNNNDVTLKHLGTGPWNAAKKPPGVSSLLVYRVQRAVRDLLKVRSGRTQSTEVCGSNLTSVLANSGGPNSLNVPEGTFLREMNCSKAEGLRPPNVSPKSASSTTILIDSLQNMMEHGSA